MLNTNDFYQELCACGLDFFCGVPDSLLKDLCACITDNTPQNHHIITANEGNALAVASGYYLATKKPSVVYMQNSGLGNIVNPLMSLTDEAVYQIPALLIIGWRGEPNCSDEPQHIKQGQKTLPLLDVWDIQYDILTDISQIHKAYAYMLEHQKPYAFVVSKKTFEPYVKKSTLSKYTLSRESAISQIVSLLGEKDAVVSTTGMISRELYENRLTHEKDFLTVGSMGHASSIALGIAIAQPHRNIFCFDGDGAMLMHMGSLPVIASQKLSNLKHIVFNNEAHDSVGGQPTVMGQVDLSKTVTAMGYEKVFQVETIEQIQSIWSEFYQYQGMCLLEVKVSCGARKDLGRPKEKPIDNKKAFMDFLSR